MQVRDRFLKKIKLFTIVILIFVSNNLLAKDTELKLLDYNKNLKNNKVSFIQTDGKTIEEGEMYIGFNRVKIDYKKPNKVSIVLSSNKSMYVNHELREVQYFNTNKSFIKVFFKTLIGDGFYKNSKLEIFKDSIVVKNNFSVDDISYKTELIYENNPIKLRKIKVLEEGNLFEIGFYNFNNTEVISKKFFSLINPYLD